jgi:hypothetical protein
MKNKLLKNIYVIISCVFVLLIVVFGFSRVVHASTPTVTIGSQSAVNGATINIPLTVSNFANSVAGMDIPVQYNNTLLTYTGFTLGSAFTGHSSPTTNNFVVSGSTSEFRLNWFDTTALTLDTGTLITLNFTVISATNTTANLTFIGSTLTSDLANVLGNTLTSSFVPGAIALNSTAISYTPTTTSANGTSGGGGNYSTPPTTSANIPGCENRTTGFSTITGQSCIGNIDSTTTNPPITTGLSSYNFGTVTLKNGSKGAAVKELQRFLNDTMKLGLKLDGILGPKTIAVIKKWQKDHKLVADGLVGNKTKAMMNASVR